MDADLAANIQLYVRLISAMVLGLAVSKVLTGAAKAIQVKTRKPDTVLQLLWGFFLFVSIFSFWWDEANNFSHVAWSYHLYIFQIVYCCLYLAIAALLFPDDTNEYASYSDYLIDKRHWLFGTLLVSHLFDYGDTLIKQGEEQFADYVSTWYMDVLIVLPLLLAIISKNRKVHYGVAIILAATTLLFVIAGE